MNDPTTTATPSLFDPVEPPTRSGGLDTSRAAATSARASAQTIRDTVLNLVAAYGPLTDEELLARWPEAIPASPSGIRTRRKELVDERLVKRHPITGTSSTGRAAAQWVATERGRELAR